MIGSRNQTWPENPGAFGAGMEAPKWCIECGDAIESGVRCKTCVDRATSHIMGMLSDEIGGEVETAVLQYAEVVERCQELESDLHILKAEMDIVNADNAVLNQQLKEQVDWNEKVRELVDQMVGTSYHLQKSAAFIESNLRKVIA